MTRRTICDSCGATRDIPAGSHVWPLGPAAWSQVRLRDVHADLCPQCAERIAQTATKHRRAQEDGT